MYTLSLEILKKCNMDCTYCYLGKKKNDTMPFETAQKAIDLAAHEAVKQNDKKLHIYFIGGEVLLAFDMIKKCCDYAEQICKQKNLYIVYSTTINGTLLNEKIIDFFIKKEFDFKVSIDGNRTEHDKNRKYCNGAGSHASLIDHLYLIRKYEEMTGKRVHAAQVICKNTCKDLTKSIKYLYGMGFTFVESAVNLYERWDEADLELLFEEIKKAFLFYKELKEKGSKFYWKFVEARIEALYSESQCFYSCKAGAAFALVTVDGKIYPCTETDETVCIGDVDQGLYVPKIRAFINLENSKNDTCLNCPVYGHCPACKCIMINYDLYHDFYKVPMVECEMTKYMFQLFNEELSEGQKTGFQKQYGKGREVIC